MSMVSPAACGYRQGTFVGTRTHVSPPSSVLNKGRGAEGTANHSALVPAITQPWLGSTKSTATWRGASPGIERATHVSPPSEVTSRLTGSRPAGGQQDAPAGWGSNHVMPCWVSKKVGKPT